MPHILKHILIQDNQCAPFSFTGTLLEVWFIDINNYNWQAFYKSFLKGSDQISFCVLYLVAKHEHQWSWQPSMLCNSSKRIISPAIRTKQLLYTGSTGITSLLNNIKNLSPFACPTILPQQQKDGKMRCLPNKRITTF